MNNKYLIPTRKIKWISSLKMSNKEKLIDLQEKLELYYRENEIYYEDIDFTANIWEDKTAIEQQDIIKEIKGVNNVLEIGCGRTNILKAYPDFEEKYYGIDFSQELIESNTAKFRKAEFKTIASVNKLPYANETFELVFSHFVIEHVIFPNEFLDENVRVLKPGGKLIVLCPDFLGRGQISSQRAGFSQGTGREKIKRGVYLDAVVTGIDNKLVMPIYAAFLKIKNFFKPNFYINIQPTCFTDKFNPLVDAV